MKDRETSCTTATNTSSIQHHHTKHSSVFSSKSFTGFLTKNSQNTNNSILDVSRDIGLGQETPYNNQNDYTHNSSFIQVNNLKSLNLNKQSQISALTRHEQNKNKGTPIINMKRMQIIRKKKTVSIGGIQPNQIGVQQNIQEDSQIQKFPTNNGLEPLNKNFINSADFVSQQLEFRCDRTIFEAIWVLVSSYIMMIFQFA